MQPKTASQRQRVSVVIAAYNEEEHIGRLITSLHRQTLIPYEILVVDDGSVDETGPVAAARGATVIRVSHRGPARARNTGAERASGKILVFLDGDMDVESDFIDKLTAPIRFDGAVGTFSKEIYVGNPENEWSRCYARIRRLAFPRLLPEDFPDLWANYRAILRASFIAVGGYDDVGYGEDMTLAPKLAVLARAAPGAVCFHFNPSTPGEIFENGRWIGRGHDIGDVVHPWRDNSPWRAIAKGVADIHSGTTWRALPARIAYHGGVLIGMTGRLVVSERHWK